MEPICIFPLKFQPNYTSIPALRRPEFYKCIERHISAWNLLITPDVLRLLSRRNTSDRISKSVLSLMHRTHHLFYIYIHTTLRKTNKEFLDLLWINLYPTPNNKKGKFYICLEWSKALVCKIETKGN